MSDCHMPLASIDREETRKSCVSLGESVRIDLLEQDGEFLGLGAVSCGGVSLRNPSRPMFVFIRNPWGIQLCNFRLAQHEERAGETRLIFTMDAFQGWSNGLAASRVPACSECQRLVEWPDAGHGR